MIEQQYIDLFTQFREELDAHSVKGLNIHRDAAFEVFRQIGFPTSKQEDYRQSDIVRAFDAELGLNLRNIPVPVNPYNAFKCDVPNLSTHLYFLINDRYYERFQPAGNLPQGVFAGSMQLFLKSTRKFLQPTITVLPTIPTMGWWHTIPCLRRMAL